MRKLSALIVLGLFFTSVLGACEYSLRPGDYSGGCSQNCKDFANIEQAKVACAQDKTCNAITYSQKQSGGGASTGASGNGWGYQLRASTGTARSPSGETTWVKEKCEGDFVCDYQPYKGYYLGGCFDNCKDYSTLKEAQDVCRKSQGCGGVTFSKKHIGGNKATNAFDGAWGYQLRSSYGPSLSPNGEDSWAKINCKDYKIIDCYEIRAGDYSGGCSQNCKDFANYEQAKQACDNDQSCNGITFSQRQSGGGASTGASGGNWGYQLRASTGSSHSPSGETTWIKTNCANVQVCDYQPAQGYYLGGCFDNCRDYKTLAQAQQACRQQAGCGGVTFSKKSIGGSSATNAYDGAWGYQLRSGNSLILSPNGEDSWKKISCSNFQKEDDLCAYSFNQGDYSGGCAQNCKDFATIEQAKTACNQDSSCNAVTFSQKQSGGGASTGASGNGWGYQLRASKGSTHSPSGETTWVKQSCQQARTFPCFFDKVAQGYYLGGCFNNCKDYASLQDAQNACRGQTGCGGVTFSKKNIGGSSATNAFDKFWGYQLRSSKNPSLSPNGEDSWSQVCVNYPVLFTGCNFTGERVEFPPGKNSPKLELSKYRSLYVPPGGYLTLFNQEKFKGQSTTYKESVACIPNGFMVFAQSSFHSAANESSINNKLKRNN